MLMNWQHSFGSLVLVGVAALGLVSSGCTKTDTTTDKRTGAGKQEGKIDLKKDDHSGWWCAPHGIPEEICSLCLPEAEVKKMFKDKGDWCKIHDRAQSQCFKCNPELYKKFEAMHVAKYGTKPEPPPQEEFEK